MGFWAKCGIYLQAIQIKVVRRGSCPIYRREVIDSGLPGLQADEMGA